MKKTAARAVLVGIVGLNLMVFQNCSDPGMAALSGFSAGGLSVTSSGTDKDADHGLVDPESGDIPDGKACASFKVLGQWGTDPEDFNAATAEVLTFKDDCTATSRLCPSSKIETTPVTSDEGQVLLKISESPGGMTCVPDGTYACDYKLAPFIDDVNAIALHCAGGAMKITLFSGTVAGPGGATPTPAPTPVPSPVVAGPKRFFVTNGKFGANFGGAQGGDAKCMADSAKPADMLQARALLIDDHRRLTSIGWILYPNTTYTRVDGKLSFKTNGGGSVEITEIKVPAGDPKKMFWVGATGGGWEPGSSSNCEGWTYDADNFKEANCGGDTFGNYFNANESQYCNSQQHLLCVEM